MVKRGVSRPLGADGRDPEQYIGPICRLVDEWNDGYARGFRSRQCRRGPDFLRISDHRLNLPARDYTLGEREARIDEIREFLDELVASRLVYREATATWRSRCRRGRASPIRPEREATTGDAPRRRFKPRGCVLRLRVGPPRAAQEESVIGW